MDIDDEHFELVAAEIADGSVVPFLGAGANLCDRPEKASWELGQLRSERPRARAGARRGKRLPGPRTIPTCCWVSQYFDAVLGEGPLYEKLRDVFDADYPPSSLHRLLARLPALLRERGAEEQLLVLTTNYDDLVERALEDAGEPFDVVWYEAKPARGRDVLRHRAAERASRCAIEIPNKYTGLALDERPVVLKLHGAIDRDDTSDDSYVLTEDSYIDYLAGRDVGKQIPPSLIAKMADSHFLFLGYSMRDWNMRVILKQLWGSEQLGTQVVGGAAEQSDPGGARDRGGSSGAAAATSTSSTRRSRITSSGSTRALGAARRGAARHDRHARTAAGAGAAPAGTPVRRPRPLRRGRRRVLLRPRRARSRSSPRTCALPG